MLRLAAFLLILAHGAAQACTDSDGLVESWGPVDLLTPTERSLVLEAAGLTPTDLAELPGFWSGVRVAECDLNGDAVAEKVVFVREGGVRRNPIYLLDGDLCLPHRRHRRAVR